MWKPLLQTSDGVRLFTHICYLIATGRAPPMVTRTFATAELIALPRNDNRVRPISMPLFLKKISLAALAAVAEEEVKTAVGDRQFGIGVPDGPTQAYHTLDAATRANPTHACLALDVKAAFPSVNRAAAHQVATAAAPTIAKAMEHWYSAPGRKVYYGASGPVDLHTATGVDQGDPLAGAIFCLGLTTPSNASRQPTPTSPPSATMTTRTYSPHPTSSMPS